MAFVICCVLRMELIRLRIALRVAIVPKLNPRNPESLGFERLLELFQDLAQLSPQVSIQFALFENFRE